VSEAPKVEIAHLPTAPLVTVVCPGLHALRELEQHPAEGVILAVCEAALVIPRCDY
jgi:hypothetical protein